MVEDIQPDGDPSSLTAVVTSVVTAATLALGFGLLALGWPYFWIVFPIGFGGVLPAAAAAAEWYNSLPETEESPEQTGIDAELATVREQYANGEIDEDTFEQRVERLLETESVEDAETFYGETADPETETELN